MIVTELKPSHLGPAAELAAARYRALRKQCPSLPATYEDAAVLGKMLADQASGSGVAAFQGGRLVGFLTGFVVPDMRGKRAFYSPEWANAALAETGSPIYEEMYRVASARWIADGCAIHAVTVMAHDRTAIEAWQWLGFGLCAADGVRDLEPVPNVGSDDVNVQRASLHDLADVTSLNRALEQHMAAPPVFLVNEPKDRAQWLKDPGHAAWLAYTQGQAVGCLELELGHADGCDIVQAPDTAGIMMAYTQQGLRHQGIGTALLNQALEWARFQGCQRCAVDWEPMNPPANRFWHKHFSPVCYSLMRWIDERLIGGARTRHDEPTGAPT